MAEVLMKNNAVGTLSSSISDSDLSLTLNSGQGVLFPNPAGGDYFWVTIVSDANEKEIVKVTARSTNTLTIERAQQDTSAMAFDAGSRVELRFTAGHHDLYPQLAKDNSWSVAQDFITETGIVGAAGAERALTLRTLTEARWKIKADNSAESTANAGSDLIVEAFDDDGNSLGTAIKIVRATRVVTDKSGNKFDAFASGTKWPFYQAAAPTGWMIQNITDKALRVVNASGATGGSDGGSTDFSSVFANRTITSANLPTHTHSEGTLATGNAGAHDHNMTNGTPFVVYQFDGFTGSTTNIKIGNTTKTFQAASDHTHPITGATGNGGFANDPMDFRVKYSNVIICSKD